LKKSLVILCSIFLLASVVVSAIPFFDGSVWDSWLSGYATQSPVKCSSDHDCLRISKVGNVYLCGKKSWLLHRGTCISTACATRNECENKFDPPSDSTYEWDCVSNPIPNSPHPRVCQTVAKRLPFPQPTLSQFSCEYSKDLPIGMSLNVSAFGTTVRSPQLSSFKTGTVVIQTGSVSNTYPWHEQWDISPRSDSSIQTALSNGDLGMANENYGSNIMLRAPFNSLGYSIVFDAPLKQANYIANVTPGQIRAPVILNFLGKQLIIYGDYTTSSSFFANSGNIFSGLHIGDSVTIDNHLNQWRAANASTISKVTVTAISSTSVVVTVDGVTQTINVDDQHTFPTPELFVRVEDLVYTPSGSSSLTLVIGQGTMIHPQDGDAFIGQDKNNSLWIWSLRDLNTPNPKMGIVLGQSLTSYSISIPDYPSLHPPYIGDMLCLPFNYSCVKLVQATQADQDFSGFIVHPAVVDLYNAPQLSLSNGVIHSTPGTLFRSSAHVLDLSADPSSPHRGLLRMNFTQPDGQPLFTDHIYLYANSTSGLQLFIHNMAFVQRAEDTGIVFNTVDPLSYSANFDFSSFYPPNFSPLLRIAGTGKTFMLTNSQYGTTIDVDVAWSKQFGKGMLRLNPTWNTPGIHSLQIWIQNDSLGGLTYLGHSVGNVNIAHDLSWILVSISSTYTILDLSQYQQDVRDYHGILVNAYGKSASSDTLRFSIPPILSQYRVTTCFGKPLSQSTAQECTPNDHRVICKNIAGGDPRFPGDGQICCGDQYRQYGNGGVCDNKPDGVWVDFQPTASC